MNVYTLSRRATSTTHPPLRLITDTVLERVKGIEPSSKAWEAFVLPLNYTRAHPYTSITEDVIIAILCVVRELLCTNQVNLNPDD